MKSLETEETRTALDKTILNESDPFILVGVPASNEEKTIARVILLAKENADRVVVCDDGSTDLTAEIARGLGADVVRH